MAAPCARTLGSRDLTLLVIGNVIGSGICAAHATVITVPRVYQAMAEDGVFVRQLAAVHPRYGTPAVAVPSSCAWAAVRGRQCWRCRARSSSC
jgi:amino acid transporter